MNVSKTMQYGFTIVELLVIVVVIGVLASISTVAYNGIQKRALNSSRESEMKAWDKQFQAYKALNGSYPTMADGDYCLGVGFPNGRCRDYESTDPAVSYDETAALPLTSQLTEIGSPPSGPRVPIDGTVGPYITYWSGGYWISQIFSGAADECPKGTIFSWHNGADLLICGIDRQE